ncbi:MAG TPA: hypothetical protein VL326_21535 [Kofleriaceae bacterium]|jgi:hypothetical protein|nr:hypothetical protein [Kofleriaceae bacterium]
MRTLLVLLLLSGTAFAQAPGETQQLQIDPMYRKEIDPAVPPKNAKSFLGAYLVTVAATSVPVVIGALSEPEDGQSATPLQTTFGVVGIAGLVLGPSAGHWYLGEGVTTGLALRLTGAAVIGGLAISDPHAEHLGVLIVGGITGLGLYEAGAIWDLVTLPRSVRRYNKRQLDLQLAPLVTHETTGLSLAGTF